MTVTVDASFRVDAVYTVAVTVQFGAAEYTVTEDDGEVEVTVTISASPSEEVYLRFRTRDGTAESPQDFLSVFSSLVSFPRDTTTLTQKVPVTVMDNLTVEAVEAFTVALEATSSGLPTYVRLTRSEATVTILDNDEATVAFTQNRLSFSEDQTGVQIEVGVETDPQSSFCPATFPFDVHFSYTDPDGALSLESTIPSLVRFETCQSVRTFDIDSGDLAGIGVVTGTTEVVFTLDRATLYPDGTELSEVTVGEPSTLTVAIQDTDEATVRWEHVYAFAREREQYDRLCVIIEDRPSTRIGRPFTVHFSYTDPAGALSAPSTMPSSVTFSAGESKTCVNEFGLGDVPSPSASVMFTLDRVTSAGSDVASQMTIDERWSTVTVEVFDQDDPSVPTNRAPTVTPVSPTEKSLSLYTSETQSFTVKATDADNNLSKWTWVADWHGFAVPGLDPGHIEAEESFGLTGSATNTFSFTFPRDGTWTVTATFTDSEGESGSAEWAVEVTDGPDLAIDQLELMSLIPAAEVGKLIPPPTLGESFEVRIYVQNQNGRSSGKYQVAFYFKEPSWEIGKFFVVEPAFDPDADIPLSPSLAEQSLDFTRQGRSAIHHVDVPHDIEPGPYWLCARVEARESTPDPRENNNAVCILTYVVSHPKVAEWVHPVNPLPGDHGRVWIGGLYQYLDPAKVAEAMTDRLVYRRPGLYRRVALELARQEALETDGYLHVIDVRDRLEDIGSDAPATLNAILTLYELARNTNAAHSGLSAGIADPLLKAAGPILSGINLTTTWANTYLAMIANRAVNLDRALATLNVLGSLPIDEDYDLPESEWHLGLALAQQDLEDMVSEDAWRRFSVAAREASDELVVSGVGFVVSTVAATGLHVGGIALGAAAKVVAPHLLIVPVLMEAEDHFDSVLLSSMAAQVYTELYREDAIGDRLEALTYAKYAAYDNFYESQASWLTGAVAFAHGSLGTLNAIKAHAATQRDAALEEAKANIQLAAIEFNPLHYSLKVGEEVRLEPEFKSGSGKNMIGYGVEWSATSYSHGDVGVVAIDDTGVVTALRSGEATVYAKIGDVWGRATVTVTAEYECTDGAVADTTNLGLVADCEALLAATRVLETMPTLNWSANTLVTEWDGVTLGGTPERVTGLDLEGMELGGTISPALAVPTELERLDLRNNLLTGPIPAGLAGLINLQELHLSQNQLTGCIPTAFALRDVPTNDLADLGLPYCDLLLSGLAIDLGTLDPPFDPDRTDYTAVADESRITVVPANDHNAIFKFLDGDYESLADADEASMGHQVDLTVGVTAVRVKVVSQQHQAADHTYTVMVAYGDLLPRYDADASQSIDKPEAIAAIRDYFNNTISKREAIEVIRLYFASS